MMDDMMGFVAYEESEMTNDACKSTFYQEEKISVSVKVTPYAMPGEAKVTCCGKPVVTSDEQCVADRCSCNFTITQTLCIEIPVAFGAKVETGSTMVECGKAGEEKCDCK